MTQMHDERSSCLKSHTRFAESHTRLAYSAITSAWYSQLFWTCTSKRATRTGCSRSTAQRRPAARKAAGLALRRRNQTQPGCATSEGTCAQRRKSKLRARSFWAPCWSLGASLWSQYASVSPHATPTASRLPCDVGSRGQHHFDCRVAVLVRDSGSARSWQQQ